MADIAPVPAPGLAILPQYLSNSPLKVILKGSTWNRSMTATTEDGTVLFKIEGEAFARSHRRSILDANGQKLFDLRKATLGTKHYYAEAEENGPRLFETETDRKMLHRSRTSITFANQVDPARQVVDLEYIHPGFGEDGSFSLGGRQVVLIEKISITLSGEYRMTIAPGLDSALVVGVVVAMVDQARVRARHASNAAAGGASGG